MRLGVCSYWHNRGQAVVGRQLRSALDALGHETFVLARPSKLTSARPALIEHDDIWDQEGVTDASHYLIPSVELEGWARDNRLEAVFFDQNYQFGEIQSLREMGVQTVGRFVWETFAEEHVESAVAAFDVIYSLIACERERYLTFGIESPMVRWGCHPELIEAGERFRAERDAAGSNGEVVTYYFPGGYMGSRKPLKPTLEAFHAARGENLRLLVKAQVDARQNLVNRMAERDSRLQLIIDDMPTAEHQRLFAGADVSLAPSRWEGLGLHLFEATAFGVPQIVNDNPPMNEIVRDGENGVLVAGVERDEPADSGIPAFDPDVGELTEAIERLADPDARRELVEGTATARRRLAWDNTLEDLRALLASQLG
jgi:glycosyltransferase involved in cell wall biosynthesis